MRARIGRAACAVGIAGALVLTATSTAQAVYVKSGILAMTVKGVQAPATALCADVPVTWNVQGGKPATTWTLTVDVRVRNGGSNWAPDLPPVVINGSGREKGVVTAHVCSPTVNYYKFGFATETLHVTHAVKVTDVDATVTHTFHLTVLP